MNLENIIPTINFITDNQIKKIKDNDDKSNETFQTMKKNLLQKIKNKCENSYKFLISNNLLSEEENEDSLFGFHFNNITKDNIKIADEFEDCVKELSTDITTLMNKMNKFQDKVDYDFLLCKKTCIDDKIKLEGVTETDIVMCLNECYTKVTDFHDKLTNSYISNLKEINNKL